MGPSGPAPSQHAAPTKFLRLLNCRTVLALIAILTVLSFGGAGCAQIGTGTRAAITQSAAGKPDQIPVINFTSLEDIPATARVVSCIIPCRSASADAYAKVLTNLGLSIHLAKAGPTTLRITGTGDGVRCAVAAMLALDHANDGDINSIEIFPLKYADAGGMAAMVNDLFADGRPVSVKPPRIAAFGLVGGGSLVFEQNARIFAKADTHGNSMVVTAPEDMIPMIRDLVQKLDQPIEDVTEVRMFKLKNADCTEMAKLLANLFPDRNSTDATARPANFNSGRGPAQAGAAGTARTESEYMKKLARVIAVPDPRTQSLLVSASKDLMPQIVDMINSLDEEASVSHTRSATPPPPGVETDGPPSRSATGF